MEGCESVRCFNTGVTLIEVMVSLVIFSTLLSLSSRLVESGMKQPFIITKAETWMSFVQKSGLALQNLPEDSELLVSGTHTSPISQFQVPTDLKSWKLEWRDSNLHEMKIGVFTATTIQNKQLEWKIFIKIP